MFLNLMIAIDTWQQSFPQMKLDTTNLPLTVIRVLFDSSGAEKLVFDLKLQVVIIITK